MNVAVLWHNQSSAGRAFQMDGAVISRCSIKTAEQIDLYFGTEATLRLTYTVSYRNLVIFKSKDTFLWNFVPNSGLRKCCSCMSIVTSVVNLGGRSV